MVYPTEYQPWLGPSFLPEGRFSSIYQGFNEIDRNGYAKHYSGNDYFMNLSLSLALDAQITWPISVEIETLLARTHHRSFGFDSFKLTGRYQWLDDILGEPFSLMTGFSMIAPWKTAVRDLSSFHHGRFEWEGYASIGKEYSLEERWIFRHFGLVSIGMADRGSPWLKGGYFWETNFCNCLALQVHIKELIGLGSRALRRHEFQGYGAVRHRSTEAGIRLSFQTDYDGLLSFEYTRRLYAKNFPRNVNLVQLTYVYPLSI